jgi:hypothetical protein
MTATCRRLFLQRSVSVAVGAAGAVVLGRAPAMAETWREEDRRHEQERRDVDARRAEERRRLEEEERHRRESGRHDESHR